MAETANGICPCSWMFKYMSSSIAAEAADILVGCNRCVHDNLNVAFDIFARAEGPTLCEYVLNNTVTSTSFANDMRLNSAAT